MNEKERQRRPRTSGRSRGSLSSFLDGNITNRIYGEKKPGEKLSPKGSTSPSFTLSKRLTRPVSAATTFCIKEDKLRDECTRQFVDHWYLTDKDRFITSANHIVRDNVFQVNELLLDKVEKSSRPKSASYMSTYRSITDTPSKYQPPILKPIMVKMTKTEIAEQSDLLFNLDAIRLGDEKSKYLNMKLGEKTIYTYRKRKEERIMEASQSVAASRRDLWLNRDKQMAEIDANDALFLECLRKDVLPYPLASVDKMMQKFVQFEESYAAGSIQQNSFDEQQLLREDNESLVPSSWGGEESRALNSIVRSPKGSVAIPGTSVTDVRCSSIVELNLTERSIGNDRAVCLADACQFCPGLKILIIPNNRLNDFSSSKLIFALLKHTQLRHLDISENSLGASSMELLGRYLANPSSMLEHLNVGNCEISDDLLGFFGQYLCTNTSLQYLSIRSNKLGQKNEKSVLVFAQLIRQHPAIKSLDLSDNFVHKSAACELLRSLQANQSLSSLNLSGNQIQDSALLPAIDSMESNCHLQELDLSHNQIESRGCAALSYICSRPHSSMRRLNLIGNCVGNMGYCFAMLMMREVAIRNVTPKDTKSSTTFQEMKGGELENDGENGDSRFDHSNSPQLLHILCETKRLDEDTGFLQFWSAVGRFQVNLQDPYERTVARYFLDRLDQHPFGSITEIKYFNPVTRTSEYLLLKRSEDIPHGDSVTASVAHTGAHSSSSLVENLLSILQISFGIRHLPPTMSSLLYQHQETLVQWRSDSTQHGKLLTFILQNLLTGLFGSDSKDVSPSSILSLSPSFGFSDTLALSIHNGSLAGCDMSAQENVNRWFSEGNIYNQTNELDRLKVIHIMMNRVVSQWITSPTSPYVVYSAGSSYDKWIPPTSGNMQLKIRLPDSFGIRAFGMSDISFQAFLRSFSQLPKEYYNISAYFAQLLEISYRQKENVLQVTCEQAEWILKHLRKGNAMNHIEATEKLIFHIATPDDTRRFLIRNLYFHELVYLRKKLGVAFKVLTGNVTGHYFLDLTNSLHRFAAIRLAAYSNCECQKYPQLLTCKLGQNVPSSTRARLAQNALQPSKRPATAGSTRTSKAANSSKPKDALIPELYPKDRGAFHFRNPSYNGTFVPIDAEWPHSMAIHEVGKVRFEFVSYDMSSKVMIPSMEFTSGSRIPVVVPSTPITEEAQRVRKEAFVDILMNNVFASSQLLRYSEKIMQKKRYQPKNCYHMTEKNKRSGKYDLDRSGLFNLYESSEKIFQQAQLELQQSNERMEFSDDDEEEEEDDDDDGEEEENEDGNDDLNEIDEEAPSGEDDSARKLPGQIRVKGAVGIKVGGRLGRGTFLKLQDQSEDIDTGVRQAFVRVNQVSSKAGGFINEGPNFNSGEKSRGMIVTNVTHTSNNEDAQEHLVLEKRKYADQRTKKSKISKAKKPMFRKNRTVFEKMHLAESTDWWRDLLDTTHTAYLRFQKKALMKAGANAYKETLTTRELRNLDLGKLERETYPEEVYAMPAYEAAAQIPLYRHFDMTASNSSSAHPRIESLVMPSRPLSPTASISGTSAANQSHTSASPQDKLNLLLQRAVSICLLFEDQLLALEVFLLYNVWLDSYQVGLILKAFQQRLLQQLERGANYSAFSGLPPSRLAYQRDDPSIAGGSATQYDAMHTNQLQSFPSHLQTVVLQHVLSLLWSRITDKATNALTATLQHHFREKPEGTLLSPEQPISHDLWQNIWNEQSHRVGILPMWSPIQPTASSPYTCDLAQSDQRYLCQQLMYLLREDRYLARSVDCWYKASQLQPFVVQNPFAQVGQSHVVDASTPTAVNFSTAVAKWPEKDLYPMTGIVIIIIREVPHAPATVSAAVTTITTAITTDTTESVESAAAPNWAVRKAIWQTTPFAACMPSVSPELASVLFPTDSNQYS
jgi:Ran GTPase-activating protein (RanGAP) involved in mRNA processing and transport